MEHAGMEGGSLNLVVFDDEQGLRQLLSEVGCAVDESGLIHDPEGNPAICSSCSRRINVAEVGHVLPGSHYFYCDDQACVIDYLDRFG